MSKDTKLATKPETAVGTPQSGLGFENFTINDMTLPQIRLYHKMMSTDIQAEYGDYLDTLSGTNLGKEIRFFVLAQKSLDHEKRNDAGEVVDVVEKKHMLIIMEDLTGFPYILALNPSGKFAVKNLNTQLYTKNKKDDSPIYATLVVATAEKKSITLKNGKNVTFAQPIFQMDRNATKEEMEKLSKIYQENVACATPPAQPLTEEDVLGTQPVSEMA